MSRFSATSAIDWLLTHDPLDVIAWSDPVVDPIGHAPRSVYVETYWLPVLGPSAVWALRRLTAWLDAAPDGYQLSLAALGQELGLGAGTSRNSAIVRTLSRLMMFGLATPDGDRLAVRRAIAPLSHRQARTLPQHLALHHDAEHADTRPIGDQGDQRSHSAAPSAPVNLTAESHSAPLSHTARQIGVARAVGEVRPGDAHIDTCTGGEAA